MATNISQTKAKKKGDLRKKVKAKAPRLTEEELNEDVHAILSTCNPYMSENCVEFDRRSDVQAYKPVSDYKKPVLALKMQSKLRKKKSEGEEILFGKGEVKDEEETRTQFNVRSVVTQTSFEHASAKGNQIDSSLYPVLDYKGQVSKSEILAAYELHEKKKKEKDRYSWIPDAMKKVKKYIGRKKVPFQDSNIKYLRLCGRIVDQNLSGAKLDYSFYDNPNDEFNPNFGSLLPLWRFSGNLIKDLHLSVTDIVWNTHFADLFAVSYRTLKEDEADEDDFGMIHEKGVLCVFSLKGPSYPEKIMKTSSAVCCLSFHPAFSHLLAAGCADGSLNVYDLRRELNVDPAGTNKITEEILHLDNVNKLRWLPDVLPQKFCTISTDGRVLNWQFLLNDLSLFDDVTSLKIKDWDGEAPPKGIETETEPSSLDEEVTEEPEMRTAGTSMCLNPHVSELLVVGTSTGVIYKCSFDDKKQMEIYEDHKRTVSRVQWNPYHQRVYLSCSDDMTVRIWDHSVRESAFEFFFENDVRDACWAPFSSTLFAAISGIAVVYVFDLSVDKKEAIGNFTVYTAKERINLTTVCFHPTKPVLMVGDERGNVHSFKLSPNLRSSLQALESMDKAKFIEGEVAKMEKLLAPAKGKLKRN